MRPAESFFGYPGPRLLRAIEDQIAQGDAGDVARLVQRINAALMSDSYRADASDWETADDAAEGPARVRLPPRLDTGETPAAVLRGPDRLARRPGAVARSRAGAPPPAPAEDQFVYEQVVVGSFEDAVARRALQRRASSRW